MDTTHRTAPLQRSSWIILHQDLPGWPSQFVLLLSALSLFYRIRPWGNCGMRTSLCCALATEDTEPQLGQISIPEAGKLACTLALSDRHILIHLTQYDYWSKAMLVGGKFGQQQADSWQWSITNTFACYGVESINTNTKNCSSRLSTLQTVALWH